MVVLIWTGVNVLLFLVVFYAWAKVFWMLKKGVGSALSFLFLLSLLSFKEKQPTDKAKNLLVNDKPAAEMGNWSTLTSFSIHPSYKFQLLVEGKRTPSVLEPVGLYVTVAGVVVGHHWEPLMGVVNSTDGQLDYQVVISHDWRLLGFRVYTTIEEYTGKFPIKN